MPQPASLPFSIPLLLLDILGGVLTAVAIITHFGELQLLPAVLVPWALPLAGTGLALGIPFVLDVVRRARARRQGAAAAAQDSAVRRG